MTRRPVLTVVSSRDHDGPGGGKKSLPNVLDPDRMRAEFPEMWSRWLRSEFRNAEHVAVAFGVTFQTACNWLGGTSRPTGDKVAMAMMTPAWRGGLEREFGRAA